MLSLRYPFHIAVLACFLAKGYGGRTVIIPETNSVIEHTPLRLDCFYKGSLPVNTTFCRWGKVENETTILIGFFSSNCNLSIVTTYNFECTNKTANSMYINSTSRALHEAMFSCVFNVDGAITETGTATVLVKVPVSGVNLTEPDIDDVITTENGTVTFICNASAAHPRPRITWYSDAKTPFYYTDDVEITNNTAVLYDYDGYLYTVMSILTFYPTKNDNGSSIYCNASNIEHQSISSTRKALLYVQYSPSTPALFTLSDVSIQNVSVIINNNLTIICKSSGNPFPSYVWTTSQNKEVSGENLNIENIKKTDEGMYSCMAYNAFATAGGKRNHSTSASIQVTVLYPPESPKLYYIRSGITEVISSPTINVVKEDNASVLCNSTGKPLPVSVWKGAESNDILSLSTIEADSNYNCTSSNVMTETEGGTTSGLESRMLTIHVLYPPRNPVILIELLHSTKEALNYTGILEGSEFRLHCNVVSNPPSSYKWTGPVSSNHMSNFAELRVSNIQRNQSGPYICDAQNIMERSYGNNETGRNNQSIYFNILYKAAIKYFGAADFENDNNMMTLNQGEEMQIICKVESNPFSNSTIFFNGHLVNETIQSDTVTYNLIDSNCSDAGQYICKGKNEYNNGAEASKELFLYVKCLPQPSASQPPEKNVSAALSDSALFRFHTALYYDPGITEFRWLKQETDSRILLRNGTKTYISSSDTHSVLRITNVSDADYGVYILEYNNSVGMNNFTFYLQQRDQTVSEEIQQGNDKNYFPIVIGVVITVLVIVGITLGMVIYTRRVKQKTDSNNSDRSYDNICGMSTKSGGNDINREPVYEGLKPVDERGYVEMKERTYDILNPKDSAETNDPVYTNLKL